MTDYKDKLYEKIAEVVSYVCNNPAIYFSETDIHVLMMKALMEIGCLKKMKDTNCTIGMNRDGGVSSTKYKTMLVHREYGHNDYKKATSDIVIFDEQDVKSIDDPINLKSNGKYLEPKYIFEFGTEKTSGKKEKYTAHVKNDLEKLSKCGEGGSGFLIHIHRNKAQGKNDKTIRKYQNEIKEAWEAWKEEVGEDKAKVKVLVFFVDIGVSNRPKPSKVKMFNPYPKNNKTADWPYVNLKKIEKIIKIFLKEERPSLVGIKKLVK